MYLVKLLCSTGAVVWAQSYGGNDGNEYAVKVRVDSNGNIFMSGIFTSSTLTLGSITLTNLGTYDNFWAKLGDDGTPLVARRLGGSGNDIGSAIAITSDGKTVYQSGVTSSPSLDFGGSIYTTGGNYDVFIGVSQDVRYVQMGISL